MIFRLLAAVLLLAAMGGRSTLQDSRVSFKDALQACRGALGTVSFSLGHTRIAASAGVDTDESGPGENGLLHAMFQQTSGTKSAAVTIDPRQRSVSAKNLRVVRRGAVACIYPD